jgi:hypothetical protein
MNQLLNVEFVVPYISEAQTENTPQNIPFVFHKHVLSVSGQTTDWRLFFVYCS